MLSASSAADLSQLADIVFPYITERTLAVQASGDRFVYYTSAAVASDILRNREVWLRNATLMNDFSEISHGFRCLSAAYTSQPGEILKAVLAQVHPALTGKVEAAFSQLVPSIQSDTYVTCFSEHRDSEDRRGRLSMWRAYGGTTGVALVINGAVMHSPSLALAAYSSPVMYADEQRFATYFVRVAESLAANIELLRRVGQQAVVDAVCQMMRFAVLCTKHPAFEEEMEWRVIASPSVFSTPRLLSSIEVIRGVPQRVLKIRLENEPDGSLVGLEPLQLINRVIVGPCTFPMVTAMALVERLQALGFSDASQRVFVADVPLRHDV